MADGAKGPRGDEALAQAVRAALSRADSGPGSGPGSGPESGPASESKSETGGTALDSARRSRTPGRRLPWFLAFTGGVLGLAAAVYHRADFTGVALTTGLFAVISLLMGVRLTRRMQPNEAQSWIVTARARALGAAVEALETSGRLGPNDRLAVEDPAGDPRLDFRLLAQVGAAPPTPNSYLEEALAGEASGVRYALGAADYNQRPPEEPPDLRGRLLQIDLGRRFEGAALMTWRAGELAGLAHGWFTNAHLSARAADAPPSDALASDGVAGDAGAGDGGQAAVRVQRTRSPNALEGLPPRFFQALARYLRAQDDPPFVLAAADRWLILYIQGMGALSGSEEALAARPQGEMAQGEMAQGEMAQGPIAPEEPAVAAAAAAAVAAAHAILPLHRLVATLAEPGDDSSGAAEA